MSNKGTTQRPRAIADEEWANRWNAIFGRDSIDQYKMSVDADKDKQNDKDNEENKKSST